MQDLKNTITLKLVIINIICFVLTLGGTMFAKVFANNYTLTIEYHQFYRLLTNMFYHYGFMHLLCNMFSLLNIGIAIEAYYGKKKFIFSYFFIGIVGSFISCIIHHLLGQNVLSAGASGAICGLLGLLIGTFVGNFSSKLQTILLALLPIIFIGFQPGVDNVAHWVSFFLGVILQFILKKK